MISLSLSHSSVSLSHSLVGYDCVCQHLCLPVELLQCGAQQQVGVVQGIILGRVVYVRDLCVWGEQTRFGVCVCVCVSVRGVKGEYMCV